jgi:PAS domain S-box-containing protein
MRVSTPVRINPSTPFGVKGLLWCYWLLVSGLFFLFLTPAVSGAELPAATNVLILYSFSDRSVFSQPDSLESAIRARVPQQVNFYVEYLEGRRFEDDAGYEKSLVENLRYTYMHTKLDLVMVAAYPALQFAVRHRDELFPGVPIVFTEVHVGRIAGQQMWPGVTGVTETVDVSGTINLVLHLHPGTRNVAIITNDSPFEKYWLAAVHAELLRRQNKVAEIDLVGVPFQRLPEKVAALPPNTVVLFQEAAQQSIQPAFGPYEALDLIGKRLPTYCIWAIVCLNHGGIGGADTSPEQEIPPAAALAGQVLSGERPENIPVVNVPTQVRVDWRQLRRWNIPQSALPPGTAVLYREPTFWQRDRNYIIAGVVVILAQTLLIGGLLWQRARKRKSDVALKESEGRFQRMANTTPSLIWMCDPEGKVTYLNDRHIEFTGRDPNKEYDDVWTKYIHPDDTEAVLSAHALGLERRETFSKEYRLCRKDGVYRWMFDVAAPRVNGDGSFAGFIGSAADITDQKLAQEALEKVSGQLIEAQEKERSRIARDLHDDICQRLAVLSMELEQANRTLNGSSEATNERLQEIQQHCSEIAGDVQALSHQLHSSKLDYLGIVAAIGGFCKEYAKQHQVSIKFTDEDVPNHLPKDVSLCLFRVAQEALHNAVKYSGVAQFAVTLKMVASKVQLEVSDNGAGFDVEEAKGNGLGFVSMQERVHFVHGEFFVESEPGKGTRIIVKIPSISVVAGSAANIESASVTGAA